MMISIDGRHGRYNLSYHIHVLQARHPPPGLWVSQVHVVDLGRAPERAWFQFCHGQWTRCFSMIQESHGPQIVWLLNNGFDRFEFHARLALVLRSRSYILTFLAFQVKWVSAPRFHTIWRGDLAKAQAWDCKCYTQSLSGPFCNKEIYIKTMLINLRWQSECHIS